MRSLPGPPALFRGWNQRYFSGDLDQSLLMPDPHPHDAAEVRALYEEAGEAGRSLGGIYGKPAAQALTPDNQVAELYEPGVLEEERNWNDAEIVRREALAQWRTHGADAATQSLDETEKLGRLLLVQKKWDETAKLLEETLTPSLLQQSYSAKLLALRMDLEGRRGQWLEAESDVERVLIYEPANHEYYYILAVLQAKLGDHAAYQDTCRRYFAAFHQTTDIFVADQLAKTCLLLPNSGVDLKAVDGLVDFALEKGMGDKGAIPFFQASKALAQYRLANFPESTAWADKTLKSSNRHADGPACAVMAMARWRASDTNAARVAFETGERMEPSAIAAGDLEDPGRGWLAWLYSRICLEEAIALFTGKSE